MFAPRQPAMSEACVSDVSETGWHMQDHPVGTHPSIHPPITMFRPAAQGDLPSDHPKLPRNASYMNELYNTIYFSKIS